MKLNWTLLNLSGVDIRDKFHITSLRPRLGARHWAKFSDPASKKVRVTPQARAAATAWQNVLTSAPLGRCLRSRPCGSLPGRADASADLSSAGIGGWVQLGASCQPKDVFWFSETFDREELPPAWQFEGPMQRAICAWEALAQLGSLVLATSLVPGAGCQVVLKAEDDNVPSEAAISKHWNSCSSK